MCAYRAFLLAPPQRPGIRPGEVIDFLTGRSLKTCSTCTAGGLTERCCWQTLGLHFTQGTGCLLPLREALKEVQTQAGSTDCCASPHLVAGRQHGRLLHLGQLDSAAA